MIEKTRCQWCGDKPVYIAYHDEEWGVPVTDDTKLFEFLTLEGAQAGLSWLTILNRREGYKKVFEGFNVEKISRFTPKRIENILGDTSIIRNRLKVESVVTNARAFLEIQKEFGSFYKYSWQFVGGSRKMNRWKKMEDIPATTPESDAFSKDLKRRGFKFVGSTIMYAH
ncbi:MAG: DNA-3-methyladenine glycosylase I, partial [Nitrospinota bacterium]